ncbi:hypothetical protein ABZV34_34730 [Streptomyces sp. NPDC005195]
MTALSVRSVKAFSRTGERTSWRDGGAVWAVVAAADGLAGEERARGL